MANSCFRAIRSLQGAYKELMAASEIHQDKNSSEWILEYVLRHCDDDWLVAELLRVLPFSNDNLKLKKMVLLKKIRSEVSKGSISEQTLETLESLKDLSNKEACNKLNDAIRIREMCWSVAVECTIKHLRAENMDWGGYNEALRKLWSERIEDTEEVDVAGWVSNRMEGFKKELVAVAANPKLRHTLLAKYKKEDVLKSLNEFLKDAWEGMGRTFLEIVAEDVALGRYNPLSSEGSKNATAAGLSSPHCEAGGPATELQMNSEEISPTFSPPPWIDLHSSAVADMNKERRKMTCNSEKNRVHSSRMTVLVDVQNGQPLSDRKIPDCPHTFINLEENETSSPDGIIRKGETVTATQDSGRSKADAVNVQRMLPSRTVHPSENKLTADYIETQECLRKSISELNSRVEDPLPDALRVAEGQVAMKESVPLAALVDGIEQLENSTNEIDINLLQKTGNDKDNQAQCLETKGVGHQNGKRHSERLKCGIMDRNPTAQTYEWDEVDSIDSQEEKSPSASRKIRLPTPATRRFSPLKRPRAAADIACRRKHTKWSVIEEETLKKEVAKYGKGRWKFILEKNRDIFEERTEVDLKDKWRNIARREGLHAP